MPESRSNQPRYPHFSWREASEDLRGLQDRISSYQGYFRDADRADIADGLERAILLLIEAQRAAEQLHRQKKGGVRH
jgi:hypothetical protein